ncbi:MAG: hypothetical protein ACRD1T_01210 [Acidimicrobiia bacterium]
MAAPLKSAVVVEVDRLVERMLEIAIVTWSAAGWVRYDDMEVNCSIQLFRFGDEAIRNTPRLRVLSLNLEWFQPTVAMLHGNESAVGMRRPDLRVSVGHHAARILECKRLAASGGLPREYVEEGMTRFLSGDYEVGEDAGYMIAYLSDDEVASIAAVNQLVRLHPDMGNSHQLGGRRQTVPVASWYSSSHPRVDRSRLSLRHFVVWLP